MRINKTITSTVRALLLTAGVCLCVMNIAQAATLVSGSITANTTWTLALSPYQVTAEVSIDNGATLSIEAGVVVYLDAGKNLSVTNGTLNARGTAGLPITFTSTLDTTGGTPVAGSWGQIRFLNGSNDSTTIIEHAQIRYGQGINIQAASPTFNYLQLTQNLGSAISIDLNSSPKGVGNQATGNGLNGISVPAGDIVTSVTWGMKGIPYVVAGGGVVSVGTTPVITGLSTNTIQQGETISATLSGTRLAGAQTVSFSKTGIAATLQGGAVDTSVPIQLTASPTATLGFSDISLQVAAGTPNLIAALQIIQPQPTVTSLTPSSVYATQSGIVLAVAGKNFVPGSIIQIDGSDLTTTYVSASSLSTTLPALTAGNKRISVKQPDPLVGGNVLLSEGAALVAATPLLTQTPATVAQTQGQPLTLTVGIPFPAPVGGVVVNLSSDAGTTAGVPASVIITEGTTSAAFAVTTTGVGSVNITASSSGFANAVSVVTLNGTNVRRYAMIPTLTNATSSSTIGVASASSSYETGVFGVYSAFDNNLNGRWSTATTALGNWLEWSFVTAHSVTEFEYFTYNFLYTQLQYSDDNVTWLGASAVYQDGGGNYIHPSTTGSTPHRFWRLYVSQVYGATVANWYGYEKVQLYSDVPLATTASGSYSTGIPSLATDGNIGTGWNGGGFAPAWIAMDLGVSRSINEVRVYAGTGWPAGITYYNIEVSNDAVAWTVVGQASSGAYWTNTPVTASARYVRLAITSHSGGSWISLSEFQVY